MRHPGGACTLRQIADPADIGLALGDRDHAAGLQGIEDVARLDRLIISGQRQRLLAVEQRAAFVGSLRELFEQYELNVISGAIMNPPDPQGRTTNHKSYGINQMRQMLEVGSLMVNENCQDFLREAQNYYVDTQGRFSDPDDCIDSARYGLLACLQGIAEPWDNRTRRERMLAQRDRYVPRAPPKSDWKRTYSPNQ